MSLAMDIALEELFQSLQAGETLHQILERIGYRVPSEESPTLEYTARCLADAWCECRAKLAQRNRNQLRRVA